MHVKEMLTKGKGELNYLASSMNLSKRLKTEVQDTLNISKRQIQIGCKRGYY